MRNKIGKLCDAIDKLTLDERVLKFNTLILGEQGSGKTNLACKIRNFAIDSNVPTFYIDFSNPDENGIERRFKDEFFNYIRFEESEAFDKELQKMIDEKKHIYMAASPTYFASKASVKSKLTQVIQKQDIVDNYYYFLHDIENLNGFYTKFEDFLFYMLNFAKVVKYGITFLAQPHEIFDKTKVKLIFTYLYIGKCTNVDYYNTASLKNLPKNKFVYQYRTEYPTILFNNIKTHTVEIDEYLMEE